MMGQRLMALRETMRLEGLFAVVVTNVSPHGHLDDFGRWAALKWMTGIETPEGIYVVTMRRAAIWVDACDIDYVRKKLEGADVEIAERGADVIPLMAMWLQEELEEFGYKKSTEVSIDGMCSSVSFVERLIVELRRCGGMTLRTNLDPMKRIWKDRPAIPIRNICIQAASDGGETIACRLGVVRRALHHLHGDGVLLTMPDDVGWVLCLRDEGVDGIMMPPCYLLVAQDKATLFVDERCLTDDGACMLARTGVTVDAYEIVGKGLEGYFEYNILVDPDKMSYALMRKIRRYIVVAKLPAFR